VGRIFDVLGSDHPTAIPQKRIRRYKGDQFDYLLTNNPDELRDRLIAEFPGEKKGILKFFRAAWNIGRSFDNYSNVFRTEETMSFFERLRNKIRLLKFAVPFIPYITYSGEKGLKKGLNRFFKDIKIQNIFASETELLSCLVPIGWAYFGDFQSPPKGGGQVIPEWLEHIVGYYQNAIHCRCRVTEILLENNISKGVIFESRGQQYTINSKYVIAACDVETLYEKMLPVQAVPAALKKKLRKAELYSSSVTISIALDCPAEALGFNEELIHIARESLSYQAQQGGDPLKSEISILAPSLRDKSLAPEGQGTLVLFMPAFMDYNNNWFTQKDASGNLIQGPEYRKLKEEISEKIIKRVADKLAPDLPSHILFYETATPVTHWRYTGNKDGTMMGAKPGRQNMQSKVAHYRTPVKNLILGGHWAELGGGVPIAVKAGSNAALLIFKKENKQAFELLAEYMDSRISLKEFQLRTCFKSYDNSWEQKPTPAQRHAAVKLI
jgi:prolycopene isomerase